MKRDERWPAAGAAVCLALPLALPIYNPDLYWHLSAGKRIFETVRGHYTLTLAGNLPLSEKAKIEVKRPDKVFASVLPLE